MGDVVDELNLGLAAAGDVLLGTKRGALEHVAVDLETNGAETSTDKVRTLSRGANTGFDLIGEERRGKIVVMRLSTKQFVTDTAADLVDWVNDRLYFVVDIHHSAAIRSESARITS